MNADFWMHWIDCFTGSQKHWMIHRLAKYDTIKYSCVIFFMKEELASTSMGISLCAAAGCQNMAEFVSKEVATVCSKANPI